MLVFSVAILFSIQNRSEVTLHFAFPAETYQWFEIPQVPFPLFLVILCSIFLGVLIGGASDFYRRFQLKRIIRQNRKRIEHLEREIESLQGPVVDQPSLLKTEGQLFDR